MAKGFDITMFFLMTMMTVMNMIALSRRKQGFESPGSANKINGLIQVLRVIM